MVENTPARLALLAPRASPNDFERLRHSLHSGSKATTPTEVISALEAALAAAPGETALRLHLADLLTTAGNHTRALHHVRAILATDPGHVPALKLFARLQSATSSSAEPNEDEDEDDEDEDDDDPPAATGK